MRDDGVCEFKEYVRSYLVSVWLKNAEYANLFFSCSWRHAENVGISLMDEHADVLYVESEFFENFL